MKALRRCAVTRSPQSLWKKSKNKITSSKKANAANESKSDTLVRLNEEKKRDPGTKLKTHCGESVGG